MEVILLSGYRRSPNLVDSETPAGRFQSLIYFSSPLQTRPREWLYNAGSFCHVTFTLDYPKKGILRLVLYPFFLLVVMTMVGMSL
jgi:hypothetical protein